MSASTLHKLFQVFLLIPLLGCTGNLNSDERYGRFIGKSFRLSDTASTTWHLWWQRGLTRLRDHSQGYVLTTADPANQSPLSYHSKRENAVHIGSADQSTVTILNIYEFGMENPWVRATANIALKDGQTLPCEIVWFPFFGEHLTEIE